MQSHSSPACLEPRIVLAPYSLDMGNDALSSLGNHGGFSGARLWRIESRLGPMCLRAWPAGGMTTVALCSLHELMARARQGGLDFVPAVIPTNDGGTWVEHAGRIWEVTSWLPGQADFHQRPSPERLRATCVALARLHAAWTDSAPIRRPCPAVQRRLRRIGEWTDLVASGWRGPLAASPSDPARPWAERAWHLLNRFAERVPLMLAPWTARDVTLQPCLCDIWHDHVLFVGDEVTGLIDYGAFKIDQVAVDLARLLGSLVGADRKAWEIGVQAYRRVRPLSTDEEALAQVLDETGHIVAAANWLLWLYREGREFEDRAGAARPLALAVARLEALETPQARRLACGHG
jgi:Ser/Thr protein kinase RdoA (MazF antagonist)